MRVTVKNEDPLRVLHVVEETYSINQPGSTPHRTQNTIVGGEERAFYVHAAKRLLVTEDGDASIPVTK